MDLDEWELLPTDAFLDNHHHLHHHHHDVSPSSDPNSLGLIDMDYFQKFIDPSQNHKIGNSRLVPVVPIKFHEEIGEIPVEEKEIPEDHQTSKVDHQLIKAPKPVDEQVVSDQETISQVFFKKLKEKNEFVDMKMDSPKSLNKGFVPQIDVGTYQFEERDEKLDEEGSELKKKEEGKEEDDDENNGGLNFWKWAMSGIGAIFSFGFAAATVSLIVLGNRHREKHPNKTQELHFQLYTNEKRMKQVVHHATKLNEAINAVRAAPLTGAHITIGGYYEGL